MNEIANVAQVEEALLVYRQLEDEIRQAELKRDQSIDFYRERIEDAKKIFDAETAPTRCDMKNIANALQRFYDENPPRRGKTLKFAGGAFGWHKPSARYKCGDSEAGSDNPTLLDFVKNGHEDFLHIVESVDWKKLKAALVADGENVYLADSGEVIPDMRAIPQPDNFTVKTKKETAHETD